MLMLFVVADFYDVVNPTAISAVVIFYSHEVYLNSLSKSLLQK